jgi:hypothetical protein
LPGGVEKNMASRGTRYLKIDPSLPNPYTAVWVSDIKDATAFRTKREAQAVKGQVKDQVTDALGVTKGMDGFFYVAR